MDARSGDKTKRGGARYGHVFMRTCLYAACALFVFAEWASGQGDGVVDVVDTVDIVDNGDIKTSTADTLTPSIQNADHKVADTSASPIKGTDHTNINTSSDTSASSLKTAGDTNINTNINTTVNTTVNTSQTDTSGGRERNDITDTVYYESDFVEYDNDEKTLELRGNARVRYQNLTLEADTIVYTVETDQFHARGRPVLIDGADTTVGDFMVYNIKTRRGRVSYAFTKFDDTYVTGSNIVKTPNNCLYIEQGDYTTCQNPEHPHYYFYGRHIKVIPEDKVISRPVIFNVGDAPVAVLPYFVMPLQRGRRSGWLTPSWGGSVSHGGYVDNLGYYFAPNDYYDLSLAAKVQEFNSFVLNARGRYALRYVLDGEVSGRYVIDNRLAASSQQWALDYRHNQNITPDGKTRLSGRGSILSNRTFNQLYSDETSELEQQQLDANMSLSRRFDRINASSNLTWRRNHNLTTDRIREDMPSLDFNLQNRAFIPFESGGARSEPAWYNNIYYSYNSKLNVRRDVYGNDSLPGFISAGMQHRASLNSSQKILRYLDVSPYLNINASTFLDAIDTLSGDTLSGDLSTVSSWNAGINLSTRVYGMFPIGVMGITAIRHTMTPTAGYAFVPRHELNRTFYDVGISYDRARPDPQQLVNFSLANSFQGKRVVNVTDTTTREQKFDILSLTLSTAYNFEADERKWRDLSLSASTSVGFINVNHSSAFWFYDDRNELTWPILRNYNVDLTSRSLGVAGKFWDGDLLRASVADPIDPAPSAESPTFNTHSWNISFSPSFSYRASRAAPTDRFVPTKSFNLSSSASLQLTSAMSVRWNGNYDFSSNQFSHNNFTFYYDLECWEMRFTWRPEKINPGFHFVINIKKIPDIKWEEKDTRTTRVL